MNECVGETTRRIAANNLEKVIINEITEGRELLTEIVSDLSSAEGLGAHCMAGLERQEMIFDDGHVSTEYYLSISARQYEIIKSAYDIRHKALLAEVEKRDREWAKKSNPVGPHPVQHVPDIQQKGESR